MVMYGWNSCEGSEWWGVERRKPALATVRNWSDEGDAGCFKMGLITIVRWEVNWII